MRSLGISKLLTVILIMVIHDSDLLAQCIQSCSVSAGPDKSFCGCACTPQSANIGVSNCGSGCSSDDVSYTWAPATGLSVTTGCQVTATPTTTTTYTITATFTCGYTNSTACCCDGCTGTVCTSGGSNCSGTVQRTDVVVVTVNGSPCCCFKGNPWERQSIKDKNVVMYPNPNTGKFNIDFAENKPNTMVHIFDTNGRLVYAEVNMDKKTIEVDLSGEAKGIYFVEILTEGTVGHFSKILNQ